MCVLCRALSLSKMKSQIHRHIPVDNCIVHQVLVCSPQYDRMSRFITICMKNSLEISYCLWVITEQSGVLLCMGKFMNIVAAITVTFMVRTIVQYSIFRSIGYWAIFSLAVIPNINTVQTSSCQQTTAGRLRATDSAVSFYSVHGNSNSHSMGRLVLYTYMFIKNEYSAALCIGIRGNKNADAAAKGRTGSLT